MTAIDAELIMNFQCLAVGLTDVLNIAPLLLMASNALRMKLVSMTKTSQF